MRLDRIQVKEIKAEAAALGFSLIGFSDPTSIQQKHRFTDWLDRGFHGSMGYLSRPDSIAKRFDPSLILKSCRTVITLGCSYPLVEFGNIPGSARSGWIASYAIREDYHATLKSLAEQLFSKIRKTVRGDFSLEAFSDSAPVLERELGVLGNLGWIGRNANLISPKVGSTFLLAEILTDLETEPDDIHTQDHCGKCHRCVNACPTGCIQPDRTIDARRCISFLTIENKGNIPADLREKMGPWVFGCDLCQAACPWNQRVQDEAGILRQSKISPVINLAQQLAFSKEDFEKYYSGTPVLRSGWEGFVRNLILAAGNLKDPESLPTLLLLFKQRSSSLIRLHTAWAMGRYALDETKSALSTALTTEYDPEVYAEIQIALGQ